MTLLEMDQIYSTDCGSVQVICTPFLNLNLGHPKTFTFVLTGFLAQNQLYVKIRKISPISFTIAQVTDEIRYNR